MQVEQRFFQIVDDTAAKALDQLKLRGHYGEWSDDRRSGWSRFMLSLMLRCPEDVEAFREWRHSDFLHTDEAMEERYAEQRLPEDAVTFAAYLAEQPLAEVERHQFDIFISTIDHVNVGGEMNQMHWRVLEARAQAPSDLTSDRPIIRTSNISGEEGHVAQPIGPRLLFIASPHPDFLDRVLRADAIGLVKEVNRQVVEGAQRFVSGSDESQARFIQNRFGRNRQPRFMDNILAGRRKALDEAG